MRDPIRRPVTVLGWWLLLSLVAAGDASADAQVLEVGRPIAAEVSGKEAHLYQVTLGAGQYMDVVWEMRKFGRVSARLLGPDGEFLTEAMIGRSRISWIAEKAGDHRLEITAIAPDTPAAGYEVRLTALREATAADRRRVLAAERVHEAIEISQGPEPSKRQALEKLEESRALWREVGDSTGEFQSLLWMGVIQKDLGNTATALELSRSALLLAQSARDLDGEATALNNIGVLHGQRHEWEESLDCWRRALALRRATGNQMDQTPILSNLGTAYENSGEWQQALDSYFEALSLTRQQRNDYGEGIVLNNIGRIYAGLGEPQRAIEYYTQGLQVDRAAKEPDIEASTLVNLADAWFGLGEKEKALQTIDQALPLLRQLGNRRAESYGLRLMARIHHEQGDPRRALDEAEQALRVNEENGDRGGQGRSLYQMGLSLAALGEAEPAIARFRQALALFEENGDPREEVRTLYDLARVEADRGDLPGARAHVEAALSQVESLRTHVASPALRAAFFALVRRHYELYVDLLLRLHRGAPAAGYDAMAFEASERARARSLLELLGEAQAGIREGVDRQLLDEQRRLLQRLAALTEPDMRLRSRPASPEAAAAAAREAESITAQLDRVEAQLREKNPRYEALRHPRPLGLKAIQEQVLDPETVLVEYALGERRSTLWVVTPTSLTGHELPGREEIEALVRRAREAVSARPRAARASPGRRAPSSAERALLDLGRVVLGPAQKELQGKRLLIVPDEALQYVPFEALSLAEGAPPLVADHEIVTLPSASVLPVLRQEWSERPPPAKTLVVFADPVFERDDERFGRAGRGRRASVPAGATPRDPGGERGVAWAARQAGLVPGSMRLLFSAREARAILDLVPPEERRAALGFAASRAGAASPDLAQYRFVHFATHGFVNGQHPELSAMVLSLVDPSGADQDGFLSAADLFNLKLSAELVVLSGCRTALGKEIRGEGLVGLTRAFMYAGARDVVASLWNVDDAATAELMKRFYGEMLGPRGLPPAAALRAAQRGMRSRPRWRAPYYWAAFVIQGDWK